MPHTLTDVAHRATCAYWYAVGHSDATGDNDLADGFKKYVEAEATAYYGGEKTSMSSIPDQWKRFSGRVTYVCTGCQKPDTDHRFEACDGARWEPVVDG